MGKRSAACKFPVARIKKIIQANEEVGKVSAATPVAISKSLELFMEHILNESVAEAKSKGSKKITPYHLKRAVHQNETFDFLKDIVSKVADPVEKDALNEGDNRGGKRRKVSVADAGAASSSSNAAASSSAAAASAPLLSSNTTALPPPPAPAPVIPGADEDYDDDEDEDEKDD